VLPYNGIFLQSGSRMLLLNREKPPLMGLWTGVGGKVEEGETPFATARRETIEETGIEPHFLRYGGVVTWGHGGMWVFLGEAPPDASTGAPRPTAEGILAWKETAWALDPLNAGMSDNNAHFLPPMLAGAPPAEYHCTYDGDRLVSVEARPLRPEWQLTEARHA
jgi:8-oxo-dGTP diphosphatase